MRYVDRRNNVIKLVAGRIRRGRRRLEALYSTSALIHQIYIYGTSERSFLLAVVVPTEDGPDPSRDRDVAARRSPAKANSTATRSPATSSSRPNRSAWRTDCSRVSESSCGPSSKPATAIGSKQLYATMADQQLGQLRALRTGGADQPVLATVTKAVQATLGVSAGDMSPEARFIDLGGDSLSALTFSTLLADIYGVEVPVGVVVDPTGDLLAIANHIERHRVSDC